MITLSALIRFLFALVVISLTSGSVAAQGYSTSTVDIKFRDGAAVDVTKIKAALPRHLANAVVHSRKIFNLPKDKLDKIRSNGWRHSPKQLPDLNLWGRVTLTPGTDMAAFLFELKGLQNVEFAEPAPLPEQPPATTPDFTENQRYLDAAPGGIDARFSWTVPGGNGSGVTIYDVEYSWNQTHEDLSKVHGIPLLLNPGDAAIDPFLDNNHGTAVLGEIIADNDTKGVTGISWGANAGLAPANTALLGYNPANAILLAVADGKAGDVILIEQQFRVCGLSNFGPIEWLTSVFHAIETAVANGFVVIEAAGNGGVNLDQVGCAGAFDRSTQNSGAIIVGAGISPDNLFFDRQREFFSSYGSRVDLQGWGGHVWTTGYDGFLPFGYHNTDDPGNINFWYTGSFTGTSSASAMVAGVVANLQGIALNRFGTPLTPLEIRRLLVETGSPQLGNTSEHIGPRPNLRAAIFLLEPPVSEVPVAIKPRADSNCIQPKSHGVIPLAVMGDTVNINTISVETIQIDDDNDPATDGVMPQKFSFKDVDRDGAKDLVLKFRTQELKSAGLLVDGNTLFVTGTLTDGQVIRGSDQIFLARGPNCSNQ